MYLCPIYDTHLVYHKCFYGGTHTQILWTRPKKSGKILLFLNSPDNKSVLWSTTVINPNYNFASILERLLWGQTLFSLFACYFVCFLGCQGKNMLLKKALDLTIWIYSCFPAFWRDNSKKRCSVVFQESLKTRLHFQWDLQSSNSRVTQKCQFWDVNANLFQNSI